MGAGFQLEETKGGALAQIAYSVNGNSLLSAERRSASGAMILRVHDVKNGVPSTDHTFNITLDEVTLNSRILCLSLSADNQTKAYGASAHISVWRRNKGQTGAHRMLKWNTRNADIVVKALQLSPGGEELIVVTNE